MGDSSTLQGVEPALDFDLVASSPVWVGTHTATRIYPACKSSRWTDQPSSSCVSSRINHDSGCHCSLVSTVQCCPVHGTHIDASSVFFFGDMWYFPFNSSLDWSVTQLSTCNPFTATVAVTEIHPSYNLLYDIVVCHTRTSIVLLHCYLVSILPAQTSAHYTTTTPTTSFFVPMIPYSWFLFVVVFLLLFFFSTSPCCITSLGPSAKSIARTSSRVAISLKPLPGGLSKVIYTPRFIQSSRYLQHPEKPSPFFYSNAPTNRQNSDIQDFILSPFKIYPQ